MPITPPAAGWFRAPDGYERTWVGLALIWCLLMFLAMPYWHFKGKQNSTGEAYRVTAEAFVERTNRFVEANKTGEKVGGFDVVEPAPGTDIYLLARMWSFHPAVLKLKQGQEYRLHMGSADLNHGFSLQPMNMNFQIVPGYDHVITLTPTLAGEYTVICNEFCGIGHHMMTSRIIVE
jgi:cytochrome c oxidase subunit II